MSDDLLVKLSGDVVEITLNQPERGNAMSDAMIRELGDLIDLRSSITAPWRVGPGHVYLRSLQLRRLRRGVQRGAVLRGGAVRQQLPARARAVRRALRGRGLRRGTLQRLRERLPLGPGVHARRLHLPRRRAGVCSTACGEWRPKVASGWRSRGFWRSRSP